MNQIWSDSIRGQTRWLLDERCKVAKCHSTLVTVEAQSNVTWWLGASGIAKTYDFHQRGSFIWTSSTFFISRAECTVLLQSRREVVSYGLVIPVSWGRGCLRWIVLLLIDVFNEGDVWWLGRRLTVRELVSHHDWPNFIAFRLIYAPDLNKLHRLALLFRNRHPCLRNSRLRLLRLLHLLVWLNCTFYLQMLCTRGSRSSSWLRLW